jgi:hypothetical protein
MDIFFIIVIAAGLFAAMWEWSSPPGIYRDK